MKYTPFKEPKAWSIKYADKKFSEWIIGRDKKCQNPNCKTPKSRLTCSHYFVRQHYATRFDPQNCIALCVSCHTFNKDNWENDRLKEYYNFMVKKLGKKAFEELKTRHYKPIKKREAILKLMSWRKLT